MGGDRTFTTASGVVLILRRPNFYNVVKLEQQWHKKEPQPPLKKTETAFGVEEIPNPTDPTYQVDHGRWFIEFMHARFDFMLARWVDVTVPDDLSELEAEYLDLCRYGQSLPPYNLTDPTGRKLAYIHYALDEDEELWKLNAELLGLGRASEEDKAAAEDLFRGGLEPQRDTGAGQAAD